MRIAYVAAHVPRRRELASGPFDAEWIVDEQGSNDFTVFADYDSDGTDLLRAADVPVFVSPKRVVPRADGMADTAEQYQARLLLHQHLAEPYDAILYDSAQTTDWAWHEPRLERIPRGVVLGAGPMRDIRIVTASPSLFAARGRRLWALTGFLMSADFLVSDVGAAAYGLEEAGLPPRYSVGEPAAGPPAEEPAGVLALVAMSEDPAGLASIVEKALARVPSDDDTIVAILHPDIAGGAETTRDIVLESLPERFHDRVRVAEPSSDGVAEGLLAQADVVVAARPSDIAVRAVMDVAAKVGGVVLAGDETHSAPRLSESKLRKIEHRPPLLVPVDRPLAEVVTAIDEIDDAPAAVVLHTPDGAAPARRLWRLPGVSRAGLVLVCDTGPYLGEADPARPAFSLLGFGMDSWPSVRRLALHARTLHELVEAAASLSHADRANLLTLPILGASHGTLPPAVAGLPAWVTDVGSLPKPNLAGIGASTPVASGYQHEPATASIKHWAETHGFRDRVRLALPWKWGLLNRAMKDRW